MEDAGRIRLIIIGIILAVIAGGYFLFTQASRVLKSKSQSAAQVIVSPNPVSSPTAYNLVLVTPSPSPIGARTNSALTQVVAGNSAAGANAGSNPGTKGTLPKTGFPGILAGAFATSAIISGFFLRKYPK